MKLSALAIDRAKPGPERREIGDPGCEGLKLIVQPSGAKSWAFRFRFHGAPHKLTIGPYPDIGIAEAREKAAEARKQVRAGIDPTAEKSAARMTATAARHATVEVVAERFVDQYILKHTRASSASVTVPALRRQIELWRGRPISDISRADVRAALADAAERGPAASNKLRMVLSRMFNWSVEQDIIDHSPTANLGKLEPTTSRDRVLSDAEVVRFRRACDGLDEPWLAVYLRVLLLTAVRRNELSELRWSEIEGADWTLPKERSKNGVAHVIPLTTRVRELLASLPRIGNTFAFTSDGLTARDSPGRWKREIDAAIAADGAGPMPHWTFHDLRRTAASGMGRLGVQPHIIEEVLNHKSGIARRGVAGVYNRHVYTKEKLAALGKWERHIDSLLEGRPAANVVPIGKVSA